MDAIYRQKWSSSLKNKQLIKYEKRRENVFFVKTLQPQHIAKRHKMVGYTCEA